MPLSRQASLSSATSNSHSHPQTIGPWKLGKTLGRGATGRVLLGINSSTGQKAAVKVVSKSALNDEYDKPTKGGLPYGIEREIIIMKLLTHPNVLRLYDVWETSKALYLVLEYVEGGELFDLLVERGPLQEQEAVKYFRQIVLGTAYCHALGICHRDLKPENLLLDASLNVKLADFGMAALESNGKLLETSCGSPHYAAPEIVSGLKYHGAASDVWSCGVILFALLTGRLPFDDENIRNLLLKVQAGTFDMPEELSTDAQDLIWRMLTVDPMKRMTTPEVLNHRLLNKYPIPNEDLISVKSLPHPETAYRSLGSIKNIDKQILSNLSILWHDRSEDEIIKCLLKEGPNPEKTFYALLLRYRHNSDEASTPSLSVGGSPDKRIPRSGSSLSNRATPKRRSSKINATTAKNRPVSFQRRYGANRNSVINTGRLSAASSVQNSPFKSPGKNNGRGFSQSPSKSPRRKPTFSRSSTASLPRNLYNDIVNAQEQSQGSLPPTLPSKDSIYAPGEHDPNQPIKAGQDQGDTNRNANFALESAPTLAPGPLSNSAKRTSMASKRMSRRKSIRQSLTSGLKRNSITVKLLSTYAKLSSETDWEYMDKQTKRTSATFASLCDKIFNQEDYNVDDEKLEDEEEKRAREYEKLMEIERKKHEAELKARKELAKQKKRSKRRSLLASSKRLSITVTEDNKKDSEVIPDGGHISQPKRQSKIVGNLRSISEGAKNDQEDDLTQADVETLKKRSVTQPNPRRRLTPILTRRPVSRLDPLWTAQDIEDAVQDSGNKGTEKARKKVNRESMVSVGNADDTRRLSKNFEYDNQDFHLSENEKEEVDLSEDYMNEIRKSKLLNSQYNLKGNLDNEQPETAPKSRGKKTNSQKLEDRKTLIGSVHIPKVTRKSTHFSASNKRLSILTMRSTKESYRDLNSILDAHNEDIDESELAEEERLDQGMPQLRTSFADRLDRAGFNNEDDDEVSEGGSVLDFDEHLANKRSSYYAGHGPKRYPTTKRHSIKPKKGPLDDEETLFENKSSPEKNADYTFADDIEANDANHGDMDVFDNIKLPKDKKESHRPKRASGKNPVSTMLIPDMEKVESETKQESQKPYGKVPNNRTTTNEHQKQSKPLVDKTNTPYPPTSDQPQKRNRSIFRKLSWGTKKSLDDSGAQQLPSPADSRANSVEEKKGGLFSRWFSSSNTAPTADDIKRFRTILPKHEMITALYALLNSWSNFGLKHLKKDNVGFNITGAISGNNSFNLKSCKFRIKINSRAMNQKSELICAKVKGSSATSATLFKEIQKVLEKEGVLER
ncbi:hypothetical protein FT663_00418 [Candidozyma haemuli var. vulneris]|nr:hypothetical protein FT662_05248 [[Candida] haemuloni var. vulneris]KAF3995527.1 hypothetical protein FT663_00418 [[Candida] haemuloni var. vulneris]